MNTDEPNAKKVTLQPKKLLWMDRFVLADCTLEKAILYVNIEMHLPRGRSSSG